MNSNKQDNDKTAVGAPEAPRTKLGSYVFERDQWEENTALAGSLTLGQTREVLAQVIAQRDELLSAAKKGAVAIADQKQDGVDRQNWICDMLSTAIARVEGGAK